MLQTVFNNQNVNKIKKCIFYTMFKIQIVLIKYIFIFKSLES